MVDILLISGHGAGDPGASGNGYIEANLTRELVNLIASKLRNYANVDIYDQNRNAFEDCKKGVFNITKKYKYALEAHFNAFKKDETPDGRKKGSEIYVTSRENGITVEQRIMKNLSVYFPLRDNDNVFDGVKRTNFLVINTLKNKGISGALLETCFIDDADDMKTYQENKETIADAIVDGIVEEFGLKKTETPSKPTPPQQPTNPTPKEQIAVDGIWGQATTKLAQKVFSTPIDGIVSNQYAVYKDTNKGLSSSTFEWKANPSKNGSVLIKAIQNKIGVKADGFIGPSTIKAMQKWLGTVQDGKVSNPSLMVKAFQKWLNQQ